MTIWRPRALAPKRMGLTPILREQLDAISALIKRGVAPSYAEIADALGLASKSSVNRVLNSLRDRGYVDWHPSQARSLYVVDANYEAQSSDDLRRAYREIGAVLSGRGAL